MRVLSIDGGGIRGIIPARVLVELEALTERPISSLFDLLVGTSTGGILAMGLTVPAAAGDGARFSASELLDIYLQEGPSIFPAPFGKAGYFGKLGFGKPTVFGRKESRQAIGAALHPGRYGNWQYAPDGLEASLRKFFGDTRMSDLILDVIVTAYDMASSEPVLFRSREARDSSGNPGLDPFSVDVGRATSAGPTFFPPVQLPLSDGRIGVLADGGLAANNPSIVGFLDAVELADAKGEDLQGITLVSLGTGIPESQQLTLEKVQGTSWLSLATRLLAILFDGTSEMQHLMIGNLLGDRYARIQVVLREANAAMDDATPANLAALQADAERTVQENAALLETFAEALVP